MNQETQTAVAETAKPLTATTFDEETMTFKCKAHPTGAPRFGCSSCLTALEATAALRKPKRGGRP